MLKTSSIVETTGGGFEVVASGLTWVDAVNQAMTLEWNVGGVFREVPDGQTAEEYAAARLQLSACPVQADWAYL